MTARRAKNTNRQGANFELSIMHDLDRYGYTTMRSSGSRGAVDVVAVGDDEILMIQAKITQQVISPAERRAVTELATRAGTSAVPLTAYRIPGAVGYRFLTGTGPKDFMPWVPEPTRYAVCAVEFCKHTFGWHGGAYGCFEHGVSEADAVRYACPCSRFELRAPGHKG